MSIADEIRQLKETTDSMILAHYYVDGAVQEVADYVGDSYFLAKKAKEVTQKNIIFCGVSFMGESAKELFPNAIVLTHPECRQDETLMALANKPLEKMIEIAK